MMRRWSMRAQGSEMIWCGVSFVPRQPVLRVDPVPFHHLPVALHFGNDRGRGNGHRKGITVYKRFLLDQHIQLHGIEKQIVR